MTARPRVRVGIVGAGFVARIHMESVAVGREPLSGAPLARDVTAVIYGAYLLAAEGRRVDLRPHLAPEPS